MTGEEYRSASRIVRLGLAVGVAAAAVVALAASAGGLVEGPGREDPGLVTLEVDDRVTIAGVAVAVVVAGCAIAPWLAAHLVGLVATWGVSAAPALFHLITSRQSTRFAAGADLDLLPGGAMLLVAMLVGLVAVVVVLVGLRVAALAPRAPAGLPREAEPQEGATAEGAAPPPPPPPGRGGRPRNASRAMPALVLGIIGFIVWIAAPLGVAYGILALGEIRDAGGRLGGRGMAMAGTVLGIVALSLAVLLGLLGGLVAEPPAS